MSIPIFINARTDIFLKQILLLIMRTILEEAIQRAFAYAESGASGFFVPGLTKIKYIEKLCKRSPIPCQYNGIVRYSSHQNNLQNRGLHVLAMALIHMVW